MPTRRYRGWHDQDAIIMRGADFPRAILRNNGARFREYIAAAKFQHKHDIMRCGGDGFR